MRKPMLIAALALLTACGQATTGAPTAPAGPTVSEAMTAAPAPTGAAEATAPADNVSMGLNEAASERLAKQLGIAPATLKLTGSEQQEWGDSSLGCPDPAVMYMQVITSGYLLTFEDGSRQYAVHTGATEGDPMVWCDSGTPVALTGTESGGTAPDQSASAPTSPATPAPAAPTVAAGQPLPTPPNMPELVPATPEAESMPLNEQNRPMVERVQQQAAQQAKVDASAVNVVSIEAVEWSDGSLGCPQPGVMYPQVITPGYRVVVEANGTQYEYHTDMNTSVVYCAPGGPRGLRGLSGLRG